MNIRINCGYWKGASDFAPTSWHKYPGKLGLAPALVGLGNGPPGALVADVGLDITADAPICVVRISRENVASDFRLPKKETANARLGCGKK